MFGCFRKGDANDPEIYVAAIAAVLSEYPESVIDFVTDPRTGLPRYSKFLPQVAEVSDACDAQMVPATAAQESYYRRKMQIAARTQFAGSQYRSERVNDGFKKLKLELSGSVAGSP